MPQALPLVAASLVAGAASGALKAKQAGKQRSHEKEMATINRTEEGFDDYGNELVPEQRFNLTQGNTIFNPMKKKQNNIF